MDKQSNSSQIATAAEGPDGPPGTPSPMSSAFTQLRKLGPGLILCGGLALIAFLTEAWLADNTAVVVSPLVLAVLAGVLFQNTGRVPDFARPGITFSSKKLLRVGVVLLGLQLSFDQVRELGPKSIALVLIVVISTFFGTQFLGRRLGLSPALSLLVATGFSICGASAVTAMRGVSDADEEETAYAIGLVTICGSLAILLLPGIGTAIGFNDQQFGTWVGASVHDVAQTVATAASRPGSKEVALLVKLTRVVLLAPLVAGVTFFRRRSNKTDTSGARVPILPLFVVGFLACMAIRTTGWLPASFLSKSKTLEKSLFAIALVGLGVGVDVRRLTKIGPRPLILGLISWVLIASMSALGVVVFGIGQ